MPAPRREGPVILPKTAHLAALAALSCGGSTPGAAPTTEAAPVALGSDTLPPCASYASMPDAYGYCVYKLAGGFPTVAEVERYCSQTGRWETECRHAWVAGRMGVGSGFSLEELLKVCASNEDCTFELLDFRPADDVLEQIDRCSQHAGSYAADCAGHAIQRWWIEGPTDAEFARVAAAPTRFPDKVGYFLGASVACDQSTTCQGTPEVVRICEATVEHLTRRPDLCPSKERPRLRAAQGPGGPTPETEPPAPAPVQNQAGGAAGGERPPPTRVAPPGAPGGEPVAPGAPGGLPPQPGQPQGPPPGAPGGPSNLRPGDAGTR